MKKFTRITSIICAVMGALGLVFLIAGLAMGFSTGELAEVVGGRGVYTTRSWRSDRTGDENITEKFGHADGIRALNLEIDSGRVYVTSTTEDDIVIEGSGSSYFSAVVDSWGTLVIRNVRSGSGLSGNQRRSVDIEIFIPADYEFECVDFAVGSGTFTVEDIQTQELNVEVGAGTFTGTGFQVTGEAYLDSGAGSMSLQGNISGDVSADCGVGSLYMELTNKYEDFNYYIDCGIGRVAIGSEEYAGLGREVVRENDAVQDMDLDCGIGEIRIEF